MDKKVITAIFIFLFIVISGCITSGGGGSTTPAINQTLEEIPKDTEIIEGMKSSKSVGNSVKQQNEDILELKHWQYGTPRATGELVSEPEPLQAPVPPQEPTMNETSDDNWEAVSIEIISQEEFELLMARLIELGYLKAPAQNEAEYEAALREFQRDRSVEATGKMDASTRAIIKNQN